jgi:DNA-binding HxlR family transcriptional regulator
MPPEMATSTAMATGRTPLDEALSRVGDRWSLLLVDALLDGPRRFGDLLDAHDGLAPNVLSKRLRALEETGLVVATAYSSRPVRHEYRLTVAGHDLAGALRLLAQWGSERAHATDHTPLHHATCGTALEARWHCPTCHVVVDDPDADDLRYA